MKKLLYLIRKNHLIVISFVVFIITTGLIIFELDRQYYQAKKKEIIVANWEYLFPEISKDDTLYTEAQKVLNTRDILDRKAGIKYLEQICQKIISAKNSIFKIEILDNNQELIYKIEDKEKFKNYNTLSNSLVLQNFQGIQRKLVSTPDFRKQDNLGILINTYTSPIGYKAIDDLTKRYWVYCALIIIGLTMIYAYILRYLLFPVKKVISCLDEANLERPVIIYNPSSLLEKVYNNLSREAALNKLNKKIQEFAAASASLDTTRILERLPDYIIWLMRFKETAIFEFKHIANEGFHIITSFYDKNFPTENLKQLEDEINRILNMKVPSAADDFTVNDCFVELKFQAGAFDKKEGTNSFFISPIEIRGNGDVATIIAINPGYYSLKTQDEWKKETLKKVCETVRNGLKQIEFQRRIIFKEKSEANISLSRNLGHDLTNIIATSKLDLLAVQHFLSLPGEEIMSNPKKEKIFKEALSGLLNNTKFLQEIVNLYRSFTYIKRPKFEIVNLNQALDEIVTIFDISISKNINIIKNYDQELPPMKIEQRLVKLAVFNILTNAVDSIKRKASEMGKDEGELTLSTKYDKALNEIILSIRDNGTGIRNQRGEIASPHEIERIFYLGYTTKKDEEGEGLGLNWVWTIIHDFHQGKIIPANHPDGGAMFTIYLKKDFEPVAAAKDGQQMPFEV